MVLSFEMQASRHYLKKKTNSTNVHGMTIIIVVVVSIEVLLLLYFSVSLPLFFLQSHDVSTSG